MPVDDLLANDLLTKSERGLIRTALVRRLLCFGGPMMSVDEAVG